MQGRTDREDRIPFSARHLKNDGSIRHIAGNYEPADAKRRREASCRGQPVPSSAKPLPRPVDFVKSSIFGEKMQKKAIFFDFR